MGVEERRQGRGDPPVIAELVQTPLAEVRPRHALTRSPSVAVVPRDIARLTICRRFPLARSAR